MSDHKSITIKQIDISDPSDVMNWCEDFGCTEKQLAEAVNVVGSTVAAVRRHLYF